MNSLKYIHGLLLAVLLVYIPALTAQENYSLSWKTETTLISAALSTSALAYYLENNVNPLTLNEIKNFRRSDVNTFDRQATYNFSDNASKASDITLITGIAAPLLLFTGREARRDFFKISMMYAETMMFTYSLPGICKGAFQRNRPYVYNPDAPESAKITKESRKSFFSGHATGSFAAAAFFSVMYAEYYPDSKIRPYLSTAAFGLAALTSYLRFKAGKHYQSDLLTGAVVGTLLGYSIPQLHRIAEEEDALLAPSITAPGISVSIAF